MTKVVYTAPMPNYVVEESEVIAYTYFGPPESSPWVPRRGFKLEYDALEYAEELKALYPGNRYRVVSHVEA